jgi:trehalose 2-sulfotransferase
MKVRMTAVTRAYLICSTPRSGSSLLCEALTNTGVAGRPDEYFQERRPGTLPVGPREYFEDGGPLDVSALLSDASPPKVSAEHDPRRFASYSGYLEWAIGRGATANGVFGAKVMWGSFPGLLSRLRDLPGRDDLPAADLLDSVFPDVRYVWMTRADKVRQAVSLWRALQTWTWRHDDTPLDTEPVYSFEAIDHLVDQVLRHERAWRDFFTESGIEPHTVVYERLADAYEETALEALEELDIAVPSDLRFQRRLQRQADELNEEWVARFRADRGQVPPVVTAGWPPRRAPGGSPAT